MNETTPFMVFSGTNSRYLAERICASLNCPLGNMNITHFADGEFAVSYEESIRGSIVFLVQSTFPNSDNLMELLLMIDAAKRASAKSIVAVIPYFGWARQDRKNMSSPGLSPVISESRTGVSTETDRSPCPCVTVRSWIISTHHNCISRPALHGTSVSTVAFSRRHTSSQNIRYFRSI